MAVSGQVVAAILTRAPAAGGKSRLFAALGCPPDPSLLEALLLDTLDAVGADMPRVLFVTPPDAQDDVRARVPQDVGVRAQAEGDLGARMAHAFDTLLAEGAAGVILIGSDLPLLPPAALAAARRHLLARPPAHPEVVVLGPASDGGYYLIGAARTPRPLFDIGEWGTSTVLDRTRARARAHHLEVVMVDQGRDVDTPDDLRNLLPAPPGGPESGVAAWRTRAWVERYFHVDVLKERRRNSHSGD